MFITSRKKLSGDVDENDANYLLGNDRGCSVSALHSSPGVLPYKSDGGARQKFSKTPLKGTRILFYGRVTNSFPPLIGTNSTATK